MTLILGAALQEADASPHAPLYAQARAEFEHGARLRDTDPALARQHFHRAGEYFDRLRQQGVHHPTLELQRGNAYFLAGDVPRAILAYRAGLWLAPHDAALRARLADARGQVAWSTTDKLGQPPEDNWPPWLPRVAPEVLLGLAGFFYSLFCVSITRWGMTRWSGWLESGAVTLLLTIAATGGWLAQEWQRGREKQYPVVVIAEDGILLRKGNGMAYAPRYDTPLARGVEGHLLRQRGDWLHIELASGQTGWVLRQWVVDDPPSTAPGANASG
ncbi:MAG: hypothetical protein ACK4RK_12530 [Gemmataceae bacterium]